MALLKGVDLATYSPRCYVVAATDAMSGQKAVTFEQAAAPQQEVQGDKSATAGAMDTTQQAALASAPIARRLPRRMLEPREGEQQQTALHRGRRPGNTAGGSSGDGSMEGGSQAQPYKIVRIPRSREVGQSFVTSVWTTLRALRHSVLVVLTFRPDVVLVNGPGTCLPICAAVLGARMLGLARGRVIYVESIARVYRLSLTGKILYHARLADRFFVQWPDLVDAYPRCRYAGRVM
ncbi:hypothetical protein N2152v2_003367 [Parachlorella kessleri]